MQFCFLQAIQERHENSLLKTELEKLMEENKAMREAINKSCCPNCGMATTSSDGSMSAEEQQLRTENAILKAEVRVKLSKFYDMNKNIINSAIQLKLFVKIYQDFKYTI